MTTELWMLLGVVAIFFVSFFVAAMATLKTIGFKAALGNREDDPLRLTGFAGRATRNVANHALGLVLFTPLVLVAAVVGVSNELTILGAQIYFYARIAHAILYIMGVQYIRSLAFLIGVIGLLVFAKGAFF